MSETIAVADSHGTGKAPSMGKFERFLTLWVALCIIVGIGLGQAVPGVFHALGAATVAQVNLPVAVLVWLMIVPMLLKIDLAALGQVGNHWRGIATTVGVNWLVKPFSMALLGWLFIAHLFRPLLPADQIDGYIAGLILLAAAPCTAMVFVWSNLVDGDPFESFGDVEIGLVERERLDDRRVLGENRADLERDRLVNIEARLYEDQVRTFALCGDGRHCGAHAEFPRFIACGGDNAALARSADRDRLSA